ncbi:MAG: hypothetical protein KKD38_04165, partial [Candidatus Delongbacteria bacterium]|nr:hypothetical protein [Candidatus Delongbacteria bacterium]
KKIEELKKSLSEFSEDDNYLILKALILNIKNEIRDTLNILNSLLEKYSVFLNFKKINSIVQLLIELSIKTRDYKSAEEYCKYLLTIEKDADDQKTSISTNVLLAKLYSYQNKFLQSISMLESITSKVTDEELHFSIYFTLGSIYQFYNEKEMAVKTFLKALDKIKEVESDKFYIINMKLALISAFSDEFDQALVYLKECKSENRNLSRILHKMILFGNGELNDCMVDEVISDLNKDQLLSEIDLTFEAELLLLKFLYSKRKFQKCKELADAMNKKINLVEDFNLVLEYQKLNKKIIRSSYKSKKSISNIRKVSPSVKKRVKNRRNN